MLIIYFKGVKGDHCERRLTEGDNLCQSNPCWNGGVCKGGASTWSCECPSGFSGRNCRTIEATPCASNNPCQNGASCQNINSNGIIILMWVCVGFFLNKLSNVFSYEGQLRPICYCQGPWTGTTCETRISLCSQPNACYNGGTCIKDACICSKNFTGLQCETYCECFTSLIKLIKL